MSLTEYLSLAASFFHLNHFTSVHFGLGLFFILSGYVIPLSLKKSTPFTYLIRRIFRIYPSLIICLIICASTMMLLGYCSNSSQLINVFDPKIFIPNLVLIKDVLEIRYIDNVTWTLHVEMHFYILFFLFFYFGIEKKASTFVIAICVMLGVSILCNYGAMSYPRDLFTKATGLFFRNSSYITFMFAGTTLYYLFSKQWSYKIGLTTLVFILATNFYGLHANPENKNFGDFIFINHLYVLVVFVGLYYANHHIPYNKVLNTIADISYPLYLLHGFTGYTIYFMFYSLTTNIPVSAVAAFSTVLLLVFLIHYTVEKPGIALSKLIIENNRRRKSVVIA